MYPASQDGHSSNDAVVYTPVQSLKELREILLFGDLTFWKVCFWKQKNISTELRLCLPVS